MWSCPVCAAKIATRRADDLATVMRAVDERRHRDEVQTAKDTHAAFLDEKAGCWDVLGYAWPAVTSGSSWQADMQLFGGLLGWARAMEVTHGETGWHVHVHVLLCFREQVSAVLAAAALGPHIFGHWSRALLRRGFSASEEYGWDLRRAQLGDGDLADYLTKMAHEVTPGHRKEARRHGGRTPMQLPADAVETCEKTAVHRWWEWETAADGRRQLTWSTGTRDLRALAGLGREATDQEVADENQDADQCLRVDASGWRRVVEMGAEAGLLRLAERDGLGAAKRWLTQRVITWTSVGDTSRGTPVVQPRG